MAVFCSVCAFNTKFSNKILRPFLWCVDFRGLKREHKQKREVSHTSIEQDVTLRGTKQGDLVRVSVA